MTAATWLVLDSVDAARLSLIAAHRCPEWDATPERGRP